jgi:serine/threonine-protein kinase HipA
LRNHGFLYSGHGFWRLSPAFDLKDRFPELKTWISHDSGPDASLDALRPEATYFRITPTHCETIIHEVTTAVSKWKSVGRTVGLSGDEIEMFANAFEDRAT